MVDAVEDAGLDRRDVERELEGAAHPDGAALGAVGLGRVEGAGARRREVGDDVHEHRRRGEGLVVDPDRVDERLDRRPGLAPAVGQDVELRLELLPAVGRVRGRAGIREDLARPVVDDARGRVVDVVARQALDPAPLVAGDLAVRQDLVRVRRVRHDRRRVDPLLDDALHAVVEAGRDRVAAGVDLLAVVRVAAQDLAELVAHLPHELRGAPLVGDLRREDHGLGLRGLVVGVGVRRVVLALEREPAGLAGQHAARLHQVEDEVAALDDLARRRDHEPRQRLLAGLVLLLDRVLDEVEPGGGLGDPREEGHLGERQLVERLAPVAARRRGDAVAAVAVEVLVEVLLDDRLLAGLARIRLGQADRLDDLLGLALVDAALERRRREQPRADELLGDRRSAAVAAVEGVDGRRDEARGIEAGVLPERLVLDGRGRVDEARRDLVERHDLAPVVPEPGEQHVVGAVVDRRLLGEPEVVEGRLRVLEILGQERVRGDRRRGAGDAEQHEGQEQEEGECDGGGFRGAIPARAAAVTETAPALPPEAGLHDWRNDTMRVMDAQFPPSGRTHDGSGAARVTRRR